MRTRLVRALVLAFLLAAAGCGGGGAPEARDAAATPPKATAAAAPAASAPAPPAYVGREVPDAGTIRGTVVVAGAPADPSEERTTDAEHCAADGTTTRPSRSLLVQDGKVAGVVVRIEGIREGRPLEPRTAVLDNVDCRFEPRVLVGWLGGKLSVRNSDPMLHNTRFDLVEGNRQLANIALPTPGMVVERELRRAGRVDVSCDVHPWMKAVLFVSEHPYATVTGADGSFELAGVPPGTHEVVAWHEVLGERRATVVVAAGTPAVADLAF